METYETLTYWVEIPAMDTKRAKKFYSMIPGSIEFRDMESQGTTYAL